MSDGGKPPASVTTDLRVAHLTKAVTRKGEVRFELHVPESDSAHELADDLLHGLGLGMPYVPAEDGPVNVNHDHSDPTKVIVAYKPHGERDSNQDMRAIISVFEEMDIPITEKVSQGIQHAFDALRTFSAGHAAAEVARRGASKRPGGRRA